MTAGEFPAASTVDATPAWMAGHFSCYGTGLSNLPGSLPDGAMLIINDRTPPAGHDPAHICEQLSAFAGICRPGCVLLDFQRPGNPETAAIAKAVAAALPCPVSVSEAYVGELSCPVFLSAPPPDCPLGQWLQPWDGREIWLEAALEQLDIAVTGAGSQVTALPLTDVPEDCFPEKALHCRYRVQLEEQRAVFHLYRTKEDLSALLQQAQGLGVTRAVGLYQQLGDFTPV